MLWARDMVNGVRVNRLVVFVVSAGRRRKAAVAIECELGCVLSYLGDGRVIVESALACQCRDPRVE